jgi:Choline/Carnitine o-acyltransferase
MSALPRISEAVFGDLMMSLAANIQTTREFADTQSVVQDFQEREGPLLQQKLLKYAANKSSYIEQFCKDGPCFR